MDRNKTNNYAYLKDINAEDTKKGFWLVAGRFDELTNHLKKTNSFDNNINSKLIDYEKFHKMLFPDSDVVASPKDGVSYGMVWKLFQKSSYSDMMDYSVSVDFPEFASLSYVLAYNQFSKSKDTEKLSELNDIKHIIYENIESKSLNNN